jgi:hypothetical protein
MKRIGLLAGLAGLALLAATMAQQPPASEKTHTRAATPPTDPAKAKAAVPADARDEELEIMRRLLQSALKQQVHRAATVKSAAFSPDGKTLWAELVPDQFYSIRTDGSVWTAPPTMTTMAAFPYPLGDVSGKLSSIYTTNVNEYYSGSINQPTLPSSYANRVLANDHIYYVAFVDSGTIEPSVSASHSGHVPEGVYLKGYGVVYSATLDLPSGVPVIAEPSQPTPKPLSDWERTRRELRGEKIEAAKAPPPEALADTVLKALAKNGQHFTSLQETEQVTVALTLRRNHASAQTVRFQSATANTWTWNNLSVDPVSPQAPNEEASKLDAFKAEFQKHMLLGDLHMKQGKNEEAVAAFEAALKAYAGIMQIQRRQDVESKGTPEVAAQDAESFRRAYLDITGRLPTPEQTRAFLAQKEMEKDYRLTAAKLLQVYTTLGKKQEMQQLLKTLEAHVEKAGTGEGATKPVSTPAKEELPAKLVISAPKKLLEMAGAGKITFEEFRKNATVDYQPPKIIEKQPVPPGS